jgi:putative ABC transport system permease protein
MERTYNAITDLGLPDVWVMDPQVNNIDDIKPLQDTALNRVRGLPGVEWAVPLYKGLLKARQVPARRNAATVLDDKSNFQTCIVLGLDDTSLIGGPPKMLKGRLADLRRADAVIVDANGAATKLAVDLPNGKQRPLDVGDILELNDHRAIVVGICAVARTFQSQPVIYTTYSRATTFAPMERRLLSFVLVKTRAGVNQQELCDHIHRATGLMALTQKQFIKRTYDWYMKKTGIPVNFGIAIVLGFIVGTAISGQTFYNFTHDNLRHFGALKAMGASNSMLLRMILLQSLLVSGIGYGLGIGIASCMSFVAGRTELAFKMPWQLMAMSAAAVLSIGIASAFVSILKVLRLEPAIVFKG